MRDKQAVAALACLFVLISAPKWGYEVEYLSTVMASELRLAPQTEAAKRTKPTRPGMYEYVRSTPLWIITNSNLTYAAITAANGTKARPHLLTRLTFTFPWLQSMVAGILMDMDLGNLPFSNTRQCQVRQTPTYLGELGEEVTDPVPLWPSRRLGGEA